MTSEMESCLPSKHHLFTAGRKKGSLFMRENGVMAESDFGTDNPQQPPASSDQPPHQPPRPHRQEQDGHRPTPYNSPPQQEVHQPNTQRPLPSHYSAGQHVTDHNQSINPDTLPPPITDFSSHVGSTPVTPYSERLESGLMISGIMDARSGGGGPILLPPSESGPLGLQISESGDHLPTTNVPYDRKLSLGSESDDLYGSGPVKLAHKYQRSSSSSVPPLPEEDRIEGAQDDLPSAPSTPKSPQPTLVTQGSQNREPHACPSSSSVPPLPEEDRIEESDDLYSSGPVKPAYKYQRSSVPPLPENARPSGDGLSLLPRSESGLLGLKVTEGGDHSTNVMYNHSFNKSRMDKKNKPHNIAAVGIETVSRMETSVAPAVVLSLSLRM